MAKVTLNPAIKEIHGKLGNVVFRRSPSGKTTMIKLADMSRVKWSKAQKGHRRRFKQAISYAKRAMADPKVRKLYEKMGARQHRLPFRLAVSDYLKGNDLLSKK